jgi:hypothetical protein
MIVKPIRKLKKVLLNINIYLPEKIFTNKNYFLLTNLSNNSNILEHKNKTNCVSCPRSEAVEVLGTQYHGCFFGI